MRIDRIQLCVADRPSAAACWERLLDARVVREDRVEALACRRTVLGVGESEVELLEADADGPVREAGPGLFAAGVEVPAMGPLRERLAERGVGASEEGGQLFLDPEALGIPGLRMVVSEQTTRPRRGLLGRLYEVTHLTDDPAGAARRLTELFGLDPSAFVPIRSDTFGYEGTLTLFHEGALDRIETIRPFDGSKTMGRYFARRGPTLYMCYGETDETAQIRRRAQELAPDEWTGPRDPSVPDNLFLHPRALGGVMLGVSRTHFAWTWSGAPERVVPIGG